MRNSRRALITFSIVHDELKTSNDYLRGILPLFKPIAFELSGEVFSVSKFAEKLLLEFGLAVPEEILAILPTRLHDLGLVERRHTGSTGLTYFWSLNKQESVLAGDKFSDKVDLVVEAFRQFVVEKPSLSTFGWTDEKLQDVLFDYLIESLDEVNHAHQAMNFGDGQAVSGLNRSDENYITSLFLEHLEATDEVLFNEISAIRNAALVSEVIMELGTTKKQRSRKTEHIVVYLDSPLVMDLLGLNGIRRNEYAEQIVAGLKSLGAAFSILDHSVREIRGNLQGMMYAQPGKRYGPTSNALVSGEVLESTVMDVIHNTEDAVQSLGIQILANPLLTLTESQRAYFTEEYEQQLYSALSGLHGNDKARERDVKSLSLVIAKRARHKTSNLFRTKHILVTHNEGVSVASRKFMKDMDGADYTVIPPAITVGKVAAAVWLEVGLQDKLAIERKELLSSCAKSVAVNPGLIERMRNTLKAINPETAEQYDVMLQRPKYLRMSNDKFFGAESRITDDTALELFDEMRESLVAEEKTKAKSGLRKAAAKHEAEKSELTEKLNEASEAALQQQIDGREKFSATVVPMLRKQRLIAYLQSFCLLCILALPACGGSVALFGVGSIFGWAVGVGAGAILMALGYFGLGHWQIATFLMNRSEAALRERLAEGNFDRELAECFLDIRQTSVLWKTELLRQSNDTDQNEIFC